MKFGLVLSASPEGGDGRRFASRLVEQARLAQDWSFDSVWLETEAPAGRGAAALAAAAAVAAGTAAIRIGVRLPLGLSHPVYTAEDVAVLDNVSGGRTILAVRQPDAGALAGLGVEASAAFERFAEALEVCLRAWAPGPFRFEGRHFRVPANLPDNDFAAGCTHVSVTPKPAQPQVPVWVESVDEASVRLAARLGLPLLFPANASLEDLVTLQAHRSALGQGPVGAPVALLRDVDPAQPGALVEALESCRDKIGVNYVLCRLPAGIIDEDAGEAIRLLGRAVIPEFRMFGYPRELRSVSP